MVAVLLPLTTRVLVHDAQDRLLARARATPLLAGAKGSRFDLVMSGLYFRRVELETLTLGDFRQLSESGLAEAIPLNSRFTARGVPLVLTSIDYFRVRGLVVDEGRLPVRIGEAVLGARAAQSLGLNVGDFLFSDQRELYDISKPPALKMKIAGVLLPSGTPDDEVVFSDIATGWVLEGLAHGHADAAAKVPDALVLNRSEAGVVLSEELVDYNEFTPTNVASFHVHAAGDALPITAVVLMPRTQKEMSILKARVNSGDDAQIVVPEEAVGEMLKYVARIRGLLDALSVLILAFTGVLLALVTALSIRVRAREIETLERIGASRSTIAAIFAWEIGFILLTGSVLAVCGAGVLMLHPPDLVKLL